MILKNTIFETKKHYFTLKAIVSFDTGVGTLPEDQIEYVVGKPFGSLPTPSYDSGQWKFEGWYDADGNQVNAQTVVDGPMVLTAQYQRMYSIEFYWHDENQDEYSRIGTTERAAEGEMYEVTMNAIAANYGYSIDNTRWEWHGDWNDENGNNVPPYLTVDESSPKELYALQTQRGGGGGEGIVYPTQRGHYKICLNGEWEMEEHDNGNGYRIWKSFSNYNVDDSYAKMYITFNDYLTSRFSDFVFYISSYSEQSCDYAVVYEMDYDPMSPWDDNNVMFTLRDQDTNSNPRDYGDEIAQNQAYHQVQVFPEYGQHFICIVYKKDSSISVNDDCGRLAVRVGEYNNIEE